MGQKVNPNGIRLGIVRPYHAQWWAPSTDFANVLEQDRLIRKFLGEKLAQAGVSSIYIERPARNAKIIANVARPGVVIGRSGGDVDSLRAQLSKMLSIPVHLTIQEVKKPELDSKLVAQSIAQQLEKRVMFRRAMKRAVSTAMRLGAKGVKIAVAGRLGGAEIARTEWYREGRVPLHTFRADIDYATAEALTTYGIIGVKVWIFKGEVLGDKEQHQAEEK
jgi:small subunit ribosomal protein S3